MRRVFGKLWGDRSGSTAMEFALLLPVFVMLVLGVINVSLLTYAVSSMNYAVQEAARCSAVGAAACFNADATVEFAEARYAGPRLSPEFVSDTSGCGHTVRATATFELNVAIHVYEVPLTATACYPGPAAA
jgi:Flp pilus assembly protein TadG